ncbi:MAG: winged helix-turn-helix transcriptional regulator [Candidatus Lokiarchaeota archaeon]|nr:winged helix-turn-helix transcriptional regulator [Candidatus Lokiarchaeota archaeon]
MKYTKYRVLILIFLITGNLLSYTYFISIYRLDFTHNIHHNFLKGSSIKYNNITIISDDWTLWNNGTGIPLNLNPNFGAPDMAIDNSGTIHIVWVDETIGLWGGGDSDFEIMYAFSPDGVVWTNATVISDDWTRWNNGWSYNPSIAVDNSGRTHIVWVDKTIGLWGGGESDFEIMYTSSSDGVVWTNATVISDGYNGTYWNNGNCQEPSIIVDNSGTIHVVWADETEGEWGGGTSDSEIMYISSSDGVIWSNVTIISDDNSHWNDEISLNPSIVADTNNTTHVIWEDETDGIWGNEIEIMYTSSADGIVWSNATVISDGYNGTYWDGNWSYRSKIAISKFNNLYAIWCNVPGGYGQYVDIKYSSNLGSGWSNATIIADTVAMWNSSISNGPDIAVDSNETIHVVWDVLDDGSSLDYLEIVYSSNSSDGWTTPKVISDNEENWNDGASFFPSIAIGINNSVHIIWEDETDGIWGTDREVMFVSINKLDPRYPPGNKFPIFLITVLSVGLPILIASITVISHTIYKQEYINKIKRRITYYSKGAHRLTIEDVLENEKRKKIIDVILINPGVHFSELKRKTKIAYGNLVWHLEILDKYHVIKKKTMEQYVVYFPYFDKNPISNIDLKLQKSEFTLRILKIIEDNPGIWNSKIAQTTNISRKTIEYHIRKLIDLKLIHGIKKGNKKILYPNFKAEFFNGKKE